MTAKKHAGDDAGIPARHVPLFAALGPCGYGFALVSNRTLLLKSKNFITLVYVVVSVPSSPEMLVSQQGGLYYWDRQAKRSSAEVDYLAVLNGRIHPVEVKSGATGSLRSLHLFLASYPECGRTLVFSDRPYADLPEQKITFLPLYSAFAVTRNE